MSSLSTITVTVRLPPTPVPTDYDKPDVAEPTDEQPDDGKPMEDKSVDDQQFSTVNDPMVPVEKHQDYSSCSLQGGGRHNQTFESFIRYC